MKRFIPSILFLIAVVWMASLWRSPTPESKDFDTTAFSRIPVLAGGRIKPIDTVARNSLLILRGRQSLRIDGQSTISASRWLLDVLFNPQQADRYPVFLVVNPEVLALLGLPQADKRYCTFDEIKPHLSKIQEEHQLLANVESAQRTPFQTAIHNLYNSLTIYQQLKDSIHLEGTTAFYEEIQKFASVVEHGSQSLQPGSDQLPQEQIDQLRVGVQRYQHQAESAYMLTIPPAAGGKPHEWLSSGQAIAQLESSSNLPPPLLALAQMSDAYRAGDRARFATITHAYIDFLQAAHPEWTTKTTYELRFNRMEPFYQSMLLYVSAFLLVCASWLLCPQGLRKTAFLLLILAIAVHSFGMFSRMWLQGRPPVTNLYSSAIFVGWAAVVIGLVLERIFRNGIGAACCGMIGFLTLIIAHHLGATGDTLEMMVAVLDSNFWLATHVVVITVGYSAMFLAGFMAIAYVSLRRFTSILTTDAESSLARMVYGVVCFAALFSFIGTVLGGIWADQSWGRFWGWDPKENGALLIVLWCSLILHARWGGFIRHQGLMVMAIAGNAITAFSWFGVNMLGVGLHSYGFMDKAFPWLLAFIISQLLLIALALTHPQPLNK